MSKTEHSRLPWSLHRHNANEVQDFNGECVLETNDNGNDAALIVRAVNSHQDLITSIQVILDSVDYIKGNCDQTNMVGAALSRDNIIKARAALALAKGEK